jgi:plastocyanin
MKTNLFLTLVLGLLFMLAADTCAFATKHRISVQDFQFTPRNVANVKLGDTLRWFWVSGSHTTTSDTIPSGAASWNHPMDISDTAFEYVPTLVGVYKYHCTPHEAFNMLGSFTVISTAGISNKNPEPVFTFYPNPVVDNLFIRVESTESYIRDLKIYDLAGKLVQEIQFVTTSGIVDKTINLFYLNQGIYLLEFIDNYNNRYTHKITKL